MHAFLNLAKLKKFMDHQSTEKIDFLNREQLRNQKKKKKHLVTMTQKDRQTRECVDSGLIKNKNIPSYINMIN